MVGWWGLKSQLFGPYRNKWAFHNHARVWLYFLFPFTFLFCCCCSFSLKKKKNLTVWLDNCQIFYAFVERVEMESQMRDNHPRFIHLGLMHRLLFCSIVFSTRCLYLWPRLSEPILLWGLFDAQQYVGYEYKWNVWLSPVYGVHNLAFQDQVCLHKYRLRRVVYMEHYPRRRRALLDLPTFTS